MGKLTIQAQNRKVLEHMKTRGAITQNDAKDLYGCNRLAARIYDLRKEGHEINAETRCGLNRFGQKTRYAAYTLSPERVQSE